MATRIQVRRDTAANWAAAPTTVLASGEIGFETDTLQFKIGNNADQWQNLEYAGGTTPIRQNASGTAITDLDAAALRNNGNAKYLILGADSVSNEPAGLTTATDGQLLVTVAKYDYLGTSAANERFLMTLATLTTGKTYYRTYNGSWSAWYLVITADASGNATVPGDLAVNGGDITTSSTGTATVFNTNATTLNVGQAATTVSIGATTGTATIRNATTAITGNATVGGSATVGTTLGVTGNTTLTGDLAVNGGDITTNQTTATVFNTAATTLNVGGAATTVSIGAATGTTTVNNDLAVTGGDITTTSTGTATVFNTSATTLNVGGAATTVSIGSATGTTTVNNDLAVNGGDITTNQSAATVFNTTAATLNVGQAATAVSIGATTGTATIRNATTAISGAATVGSTLAVTGNTTLTGDLAVNGGDITTTSTGTATVFNTNAAALCLGEAAPTVSIGASTGTTTVNNDLAVNGGDITTSAVTATVFDSTATSVDIAGAATTLNIADAATAAQTINIGTGATVSGATKTINIGTGGATGSTTNINLGDSDGGTVVVNRALTVNGLTTLSGGLSLASSLSSSAMASGSVVGFTVGFINDAADTGIINGNPSTTTVSVTTSAFVPKLSSSTIFVFPIATYGGSIPATETGLDANVPGWMTVQWSGDSNSREGWSNTASASAGGTITSILSNQRTMPSNGVSSGFVSIVNVFSQQNTSTASRTYTVTLAFTDAGAGIVTGIIGRPQVAYVIAEVAP